MSEKRFKLSKSAIPSQLSNFCDENGRMLNSEVVRLLNEHDKQYEANWKMFFLIKEQQHTIEQLQIDKRVAELVRDLLIECDWNKDKIYTYERLHSFAPVPLCN